MNKLPLTEPDLGPEEVAAVTRVIESGWLTSGPITEEFEGEFARLQGADHAVAVSNCTAALHLAYLVLGVGPGDEVISPDLTFVATANGARYTGANVVFAGVISDDDLTVCPAQIEERITPRTKVISVVHYAGFPCHMDEIMDLARRHNVRIVEDCAHAPLGAYRGSDGAQKMVGTLGDAGCFSFFGNKNMTTGEGGMITTNDETLAKHLRSLRSHGLSRATWERHVGKALGYEVQALGYNYRLDEIRSAIGLCQLRKLEGLNAHRRAMTAAYRTALADVPGVHVPFRDHDLELSTCHILSVLVDGDVAKIRTLLAERGIQTSKHYEPVGNFPTYHSAEPSPSTAVAERLMTLPLGPHMDESDVRDVAAALREVMDSL